MSKDKPARPSFSYEAFDLDDRASGSRVSRRPSPRAPSTSPCSNEGFQPIEVDREDRASCKFEITKKKVPRKDVMNFTRQLAVFMQSGIPIMEALEVIVEETQNKLLKGDLDQDGRRPARG